MRRRLTQAQSHIAVGLRRSKEPSPRHTLREKRGKSPRSCIGRWAGAGDETPRAEYYQLKQIKRVVFFQHIFKILNFYQI